MSTQAQLEALQENLARLKHMDGGLRRAMDDIRKQDLIFLLPDGTWDKANPKQGFEDEIYRLRDDYKQEPSIVESKIFTDPDGLKCLKRTGVSKYKNMMLSGCINDPDFIGFKFEDEKADTVPWSVAYKCEDGYIGYVYHEGYEILHATHVLFQEVGK